MTTLVSLESYPNTEIKDIFIAYYKNIMSSVESEHITFEADQAQAPKTPGEPQQKIKKSTEKQIKAAADRYYEKRDEILRNKALRNIKETGSLPTKITMERRNISWEDIARLLCKDEGRNAKIPRPGTRQLRGRILKNKISVDSKEDGESLETLPESDAYPTH